MEDAQSDTYIPVTVVVSPDMTIAQLKDKVLTFQQTQSNWHDSLFLTLIFTKSADAEYNYRSVSVFFEMHLFFFYLHSMLHVLHEQMLGQF